jgi:hypothetical protein
MNLFSLFLKVFTMAPLVVKGVEAIASEKDSTTKQQMAHDALMLGTGLAGAIDPNDTALISNVSGTVKSVIDSTVTLFNETGLFAKKPATPAPAPAQ